MTNEVWFDASQIRTQDSSDGAQQLTSKLPFPQEKFNNLEKRLFAKNIQRSRKFFMFKITHFLARHKNEFLFFWKGGGGRNCCPRQQQFAAKRQNLFEFFFSYSSFLILVSSQIFISSPFFFTFFQLGWKNQDRKFNCFLFQERRREDLDTNYENGKKTNEAADDGWRISKTDSFRKMVEAFGSVVEWFEPPLNLRLI